MALRIVRTKTEMRAAGVRVAGFVPTMGALHEGHAELIRRAKRETGYCALSLFVNPTQFGPGEDFASYPRQEERDFALAEESGADLVFAPLVDEMYGEGTTLIRAGRAAHRWEGERRPGHFDGVATVVTKLFHILQPNKAYFGYKDYQQCRVLAELVEDLDFSVELVFCDTVRETDGLAMSSRNAYLSPQERSIAPMLFHVLSKTAKTLKIDGRSATDVLKNAIQELSSAGFETEYFEWVDGRSLEPIREHRNESRLLAAAKLGRTRLIDNCPV